jgi:hypothetical protein
MVAMIARSKSRRLRAILSLIVVSLRSLLLALMSPSTYAIFGLVSCVLHGQTVIKHDVNERGVWPGIGPFKRTSSKAARDVTTRAICANWVAKRSPFGCVKVCLNVWTLISAKTLDVTVLLRCVIGHVHITLTDAWPLIRRSGWSFTWSFHGRSPK